MLRTTGTHEGLTMTRGPRTRSGFEHRAPRLRVPVTGLALPLVLVLAAGCHVALASVLELARHGVRSGPALVRSAQSLAAAERALESARRRLGDALSFPTTGRAARLCVNLQAPATETYDWATGTVHIRLAGTAESGY
jgi:hypothetical protein